MVNFNNYLLGVTHPQPAVEPTKPEAQKFEKPITIQDAISAVSGNVFKKFFTRLKLAWKTHEWLNEKNIKLRINSHNLEEIKTIEKLFEQEFPDKNEKNKKITNFMMKFIDPSLRDKAFDKFLIGVESEEERKNLKTLFGNVRIETILQLLDKNMTYVEASNPFSGLTPTEITNALENILRKGDVNSLIEEVLGEEFKHNLEDFIAGLDPAEQEVLRRDFTTFIPKESRDLLRQFSIDNMTAKMIMDSVPEGQVEKTGKGLIDFLARHSKTDFYNIVKRFVPDDGTDAAKKLRLALMGLEETSTTRLFVQALADGNITAQAFTGKDHPEIKDVEDRATDPPIQKQFILDTLAVGEQNPAVAEFFSRSFVNDPDDFRRALPLLYEYHENPLEAEGFIQALVQRKEEGKVYDFEGLKSSLDGKSVLDKIKDEVNK